MEYIKVMVAGETDGILWDASTEHNIQKDHPAYVLLNEQLDLLKWVEDYRGLFRDWLYNDDESIYEINNPINMIMIDSLLVVNNLVKDYNIFYWFDVDRDLNPDFVWNNCPLSKAPLIALPKSFHSNNRKISPKYPLIFPDA